jgi:hypothetical protein
MTKDQIKNASDSSLTYSIKDLIETIEIQEKDNFPKSHTQEKKLKEYHKDLYACVCEKLIRNSTKA